MKPYVRPNQHLGNRTMLGSIWDVVQYAILAVLLYFIVMLVFL